MLPGWKRDRTALVSLDDVHQHLDADSEERVCQQFRGEAGLGAEHFHEGVRVGGSRDGSGLLRGLSMSAGGFRSCEGGEWIWENAGL